MERLPTELLVDIFTWCTHSAALTALTLGKVCRRWKAITDHSPCLFQFIVLDDRSLTFYLANRVANFYLARSAGLPFDVDINIISKDNLLPLLSPFLNHLGRWRSCIIGGAKEEAVRFGEFWDRGNGEPKLEELDIAILDPAEMDEMANQIQVQVQSTTEENTNTTPPGTFKPYTISLTSNLLFMTVFLSKLPSPLTLCPLRFVTLSITESTQTLTIRPDDLLRFLTVCPELEFFSFTGTLSVPAITAEDIRCPPPIVSLPRLRSLVLHSTLCTRILLSHLHTPALRELYLEHLNVDFDFPVLNPYLPLPSRLPIDPLPTPGVLPGSPVLESTTSPSGLPPPTLIEMFPPPPRALAFGFECALEDGDSDDEFSDYSQSPRSDHATGMGLRSLLSRSSPPLHVLEMDYADMRTKDFAWLFSHAQSLTDFRIVASDMADRVVRMLAPDESGTLLLPRLRSLELINCQRLSGTAIVDAIRERVRATDDPITKRQAIDVLPLEDVAVVGCANFTIDDGLGLAEVLGERLRFH
jgi:F-box-like